MYDSNNMTFFLEKPKSWSHREVKKIWSLSQGSGDEQAEQEILRALKIFHRYMIIYSLTLSKPTELYAREYNPCAILTPGECCVNVGSSLVTNVPLGK